MWGICVAVKATSSTSSRPRKTTLKVEVAACGAGDDDAAHQAMVSPMRSHRVEVELRARDLTQDLVGGHPFSPSYHSSRSSESRPLREPVGAELLAGTTAAAPRKPTRAGTRRIEARIDVGEEVASQYSISSPRACTFDVARGHRVEILVRVQLELVEELGRVAADEVESHSAACSRSGRDQRRAAARASESLTRSAASPILR